MSVEERTRATLLAAAEGIHPDAGAMLAEVESTLHRQAIVRRTVLGIGAMVIAVLAGVLGSGVLDGRPSGAEFDPAEGMERTEVFTFAEHDLCTWFDPIEIAGFLGSQYEWTNESAQLVDLPDAGPDECLWRLTSAVGAGPYKVHAWNAGSGTMLPAEIVEYEGGTVGTPGGTVSGHPALSPGVVVQSEGWGIYVFWVPPTEQYLALSLTQITSEGEVGVDSVDSSVELATSQAHFFAFANQFVQRLGWVPTGDGMPSNRAFDIATDSLCTWFTRQDMDRIVQAAQDRVGTRIELVGFAPEGWCTADALPGSWGSSSTTVALEPVSGERPTSLVRHPQLDSSVGYANVDEYGSPYGSWAPYGLHLDLLVAGHEDVGLRLTFEVWAPHGVPGMVEVRSVGPSGTPVVQEVDRALFTALGLAVADELLKAMNWIEE